MKINNIAGYGVCFGNVRCDKIIGEKQVMNSDSLKKMIPQANSVLAEKAEKEVPENGKFTPVTVTYNLPETSNKVRVKIEHDEKEYKTQRRLSLGVHHKNSDRLTSEYIAKGTKQDIIDYLLNPENTDKMAKVMLKLSDKTDNYYNSL